MFQNGDLRRIFPVALVFLSGIVAVQGCGPMRRPGFPNQSHDDAEQLRKLETTFDIAGKIDQYYDIAQRDDPGDRDEHFLRSARNEIINHRLTLINFYYNEFVADASFNRQAMDLTADLADLGVDLAATVTGAVAMKTILSAISAGITGTQASLHKNIYLDRTISAIITSMNARRKEALLPILEGMGRSAADYPLGQALSDLDNYYLAGTFLGALESIQQRAALAEREADVQIRRLNAVSFQGAESNP